MIDWQVDIHSVWRGIQAMHKSDSFPKPRWAIKRTRGFEFHAHAWTPAWHDGRGPYVTVGLGVIGIYRGC